MRNLYFLFRSLPLLTVLVLTGCGFHLRGASEMPPELQNTVAVGVAPYSELGKALTRTWGQTGSTLSFAADVSNAAKLQFTRNTYTRRTVSVDSSGQANEYELRLDVDFNLVGADGKRLMTNQKFVGSRNYQYDPNNVLAMDLEETRLKQILAEQAALQIVRRVSYSLSHQKAEQNVDEAVDGNDNETAR